MKSEGTYWKGLRLVLALIVALAVCYFGLFFAVMKLDEKAWKGNRISASCVVRWSETRPRCVHGWMMAVDEWTVWNGVFKPAEVMVNLIRGKGDLAQRMRDEWNRMTGDTMM